MFVFMNKSFLILASTCFFTFSNCSKENTIDNNSVNTFPDKNVLGKYSGTIITKCDYKPVSFGTAFSETTSGIRTVTITSDTSKYLLNGNIMDGGPTVFLWRSDPRYPPVQGYILNTKSLTIDFSESNSGEKNLSQGNKYSFTCFSSGQLMHE